MFKTFFILPVLFIAFTTVAQKASDTVTFSNSSLKRPKLIVGIVVDQMRWDYLYRYYDRYAEDGGFRRLLSQGFSCENTMIQYVPTITACGHASIYTGSVPAINGITGNDWVDGKNNIIYCTQDDSAKTVGSTSDAGEMSPKNLLVTTIGDELRLATNFRSKVIGLALKDRGAILPAGHSANGAYWYDPKTGNWVTSTYYIDALPKWVSDFNAKKIPDQLYATNWTTMYPPETYVQSASSPGFNYDLKQYVGKNYQVISSTPYGNNMTFEMAKSAIEGESLGANNTTDMLTVSFSSTDYIGHAFGPNSIEAEDCYLRLDKTLGEFLRFLDTKIGKGDYVVFLTADHGAANVPAFLKKHNIPAGNFDNESETSNLNKLLDTTFKADNLITGIINYQVYFDQEKIKLLHLNKDSLYTAVINRLLKDTSVERAFVITQLAATTLPSTIKEAVANNYFPGRSGNIQILFRPQWIDGFLKRGTTHGVWNPYDAHIPLLWYGWNIPAGKTNREVYITDIASTVAALLKIQMPSGCIGHVIEDVVK